MIFITQTPLRISLVGGGTDLASFYGEHGPGRVVSFTIDKYIYLCVNRKFDGRVRVSYSVTEMTETADMVHHELARECLKRMGIMKGIEVVSIADIPGRGSGLGSSSAYTVGLLNALNQYRIYHEGEDFEPIKDVAEEACQIEIGRCHKPIGKQDQYAVAYGGLRVIRFSRNGTVHPAKISLDNFKEAIEDHMLLFWTGKTRLSQEILSKQSRITSHLKLDLLKKMRNLAEELATDLLNGDISSVGAYLHENWTYKKGLVDEISNPQIDTWYREGRNAGAVGGKLCGAGGGGFLLLWAPPDKHEAVKKAVGLRHVPFKIDPMGTRLYGDGR